MFESKGYPFLPWSSHGRRREPRRNEAGEEPGANASSFEDDEGVAFPGYKAIEYSKL